eukprot:3054445-Amphidinium_carterae.1
MGLHTGRGKFNYHYLKGQDCWPSRKKKARAAGFSTASNAVAAPPPETGIGQSGCRHCVAKGRPGAVIAKAVLDCIRQHRWCAQKGN